MNLNSILTLIFLSLTELNHVTFQVNSGQFSGFGHLKFVRRLLSLSFLSLLWDLSSEWTLQCSGVGMERVGNENLLHYIFWEVIPPPDHTDVCPCCIRCQYFPLGTFLQGTDFSAGLHQTGGPGKLRESGFSSSVFSYAMSPLQYRCSPLTVAWSACVGMVPIQVSDGRRAGRSTLYLCRSG